MIPSFILKKSEIQIEFKFNNINYKIRGISKFKDNTIFLNFGYFGDEFPCIMNEYDIKKKVFFVHKLRAKPFGGWNEDDRVVCLKPDLPSSGALDILVGLSIAIAQYLNEGCEVTIRDDAKVDNEYPLSWKKFFQKGETTYSKYGFILRDPKDSIESFEEELDYIEILLNEKVLDLIPKPKLSKLNKLIESTNNILRKKKEKLIKVNQNTTLETFLKEIFETRKYGPIFDFLDEELNIDLRGIWYLSWEYYIAFVPDNLKISNLVFSEL
jgi:hypothetical protein